MRSRRLHLLLFSAITFVAQAGYGDEDRQFVVGQEVMPIRRDAIMRTAPSGDGDLVAWRPGTCTLTVAEVKDDWLRSDGGWIMKSEVVGCDGAIAFFTRQISRSPSVFAICSRSLARLDAKEYQAAFDDGNEAVALDRTDARGFFCRGAAAASMGDMDSASADFGRTIALDRGFAGAFRNRGNTRFAKGDLASAIGDYDEAIRLDENWANPYFMRARARLGMKSDDPRIISSAMLPRWRKDREAMEGAMGDIDEFIKRSPKDADGFILRALLWRAKGDNAKATADLQTAVRLAPSCFDREAAHFFRGWFAYEDDGYRVAIDELNEAIRVNPRNADAYALRAWIWAVCPEASLRNGQKAMESAKVACKLSNFREAWHIGVLAAASAECGDFRAAAKWQQQGVKMRARDDSSRNKDDERLKLYRDGKPYREAGAKHKCALRFTCGIRKLSKLFVREPKRAMPIGSASSASSPNITGNLKAN